MAALVLVSLLLHLAAGVSIGGWLSRPVPTGRLDHTGALSARLELRRAPEPATPPAAPTPPAAAASAQRAPEAVPASEAPAVPAPPPAAVPAPAPSTPDPLAATSLAQLDGASPRKPGYFRVNPPPSAEFAYDLTITSADGATIGAGTSSLSWQLQDGRYALRLASQYGAGGARDHARSISSAGGMDDMGIAPDTLQEQSDGSDPRRTRFDRGAGVVRREDAARTDPILNGAQDQASMLVQLAGIGAAHALRKGDEIVLHVSRAQDAGLLVLKVLGEVQLDSPMGPLATWHLGQPDGGGLELWLAPAYHWMPVQIRTTGPDGVAATELVRAIAAPQPAPRPG